MWLLAGQKAPDHSTIARFWTGFSVEAYANRYTFVWKKSVEKWEEIVTVKPIRMLPLCIWRTTICIKVQLKPGYNVQIGVDGEYIVVADIFQ